MGERSEREKIVRLNSELKSPKRGTFGTPCKLECCRAFVKVGEKTEEMGDTTGTESDTPIWNCFSIRKQGGHRKQSEKAAATGQSGSGGVRTITRWGRNSHDRYIWIPSEKQVEIAIRNQLVKTKVPSPTNSMDATFRVPGNNRWRWPGNNLTHHWKTCPNTRQFYPKAIVPRAWVREEDEEIGQRIEDLRKMTPWETAEQRQQLERRVENLHEEAHARALREAQKKWMEYTKLMNSTAMAQGKWQVELHKRKLFINFLVHKFFFLVARGNVGDISPPKKA